MYNIFKYMEDIIMLDKIKTFISEHKAQIVTVVTGIISLLVAINTNITTSTKVGLGITFITVALSILLTVLKNGFTDETVDLIVKAIQIIQEIITTEESTEVVSAKKVTKLTAEEIKERLITKD